MDNRVKKAGSGDGMLDVAAYILAGILFLKTADVLSIFSPTILTEVIGYDMAFLYGATCAFLVEGAALALHFNHRAKLSPVAQIVKWVLLAISGLCQVFDGYVVTGNVASMSDTLRFAFSVGVPLIPIAVLMMLFAIGQLPEDNSSKSEWKGLKNIVIPAWDRLLNGSGNSGRRSGTNTDMIVAQSDTEEVKADFIKEK